MKFSNRTKHNKKQRLPNEKKTIPTNLQKLHVFKKMERS
jgi:hypothetical protein